MMSLRLAEGMKDYRLRERMGWGVVCVGTVTEERSRAQDWTAQDWSRWTESSGAWGIT